MTTACPRCQSQRFTFGIAYGSNEVQVVAGSALTTVDQLVESGEHPSDTFGFLTCTDCYLTLANDPGEGRLRRADLFDTYADRVDERPAFDRALPLFEAMRQLADHLCEHAFDPLPETGHSLIGINLSEQVHEGLNAAIGRAVVNRYKTSAETVLDGLSDQEIVKAKIFLRLNGAAYEETITTRWTPTTTPEDT